MTTIIFKIKVVTSGHIHVQVHWKSQRLQKCLFQRENSLIRWQPFTPCIRLHVGVFPNTLCSLSQLSRSDTGTRLWLYSQIMLETLNRGTVLFQLKTLSTESSTYFVIKVSIANLMSLYPKNEHFESQ